jgi:hypothetical protein
MGKGPPLKFFTKSEAGEKTARQLPMHNVLRIDRIAPEVGSDNLTRQVSGLDDHHIKAMGKPLAPGAVIINKGTVV